MAVSLAGYELLMRVDVAGSENQSKTTVFMVAISQFTNRFDNIRNGFGQKIDSTINAVRRFQFV
jgi:hypothetical protein